MVEKMSLIIQVINLKYINEIILKINFYLFLKKGYVGNYKSNIQFSFLK